MEDKTKKLFLAIIFTLLLSTFAAADLAHRIDSILNQSSQKKVNFSVHIIKADTGKKVYSHDATTAMIPASNMKIITTAAALEILGPDYQFKTVASLCGDTLVIAGSGDPLLGDEKTDARYSRTPNWVFDEITAALKERSITSVNDIILDTSVFDDQRVHPAWPRDQLNRWYACEVAGLNFNGNCVAMTTKKINGKITVSIEPKTDYLKITNKVRAISTGKSAVGAYRQPGKVNELVVKGKCKTKQGPFDVAIERPAAFFGFLLAEHLTRFGIAVNGQLIEKPLDEKCSLLPLTEFSTPIADCLIRSNKNSFGLAAEALLKAIAANTNIHKKNGSWNIGSEAISQYLLRIGIDKTEFNIDDGSGLSRQNKLSANAITKVLDHVYKSDNWQLYKDSLAVGGIDGTSSRYFKQPQYKGKVFGKTGYIAGVKSFSGFCSTPNGDYIFSILTNKANGKTRPAINQVVQALFE